MCPAELHSRRERTSKGVHLKQFLRRGDLDVLDTRLPAPTDTAELRAEDSDGDDSEEESGDDETSVLETSTLDTSALEELEEDVQAPEEANQETTAPDNGPSDSGNHGRGGLWSFFKGAFAISYTISSLNSVLHKHTASGFIPIDSLTNFPEAFRCAQR